MCGINGIISKDKNKKKLIKDMNDIEKKEKQLEVKGLDGDSSSDSSDARSSLTASEIAKREAEVAAEAPWYIKVLDTVFFYSGVGGQEVSSSGNSTSGE